MTDSELRAILHGLGVDEQSCRVVALLPLVQVAWADGRIQDRERSLIQSVAEERGFLDGEGAKLLEGWLKFQPSARYLERGRTALVELARRAQHDGVTKETLGDVVGLCEQVARVAGGLFDRVATVSGAERDALTKIADTLSIPKGQSWDSVMDAASRTPAEEDAEEVTDPHGIRGTRGATPVIDDEADAPTVLNVMTRGTARLVVVGDEERSVVVEEASFTVGRWPDTNLQVAWDHKVSREHCRVLRQNNNYYVVDCGTTNGTWVNEEQILERRLFGGEEIRVGDTVLRFELTAES